MSSKPKRRASTSTSNSGQGPQRSFMLRPESIHSIRRSSHGANSIAGGRTAFLARTSSRIEKEEAEFPSVAESIEMRNIGNKVASDDNGSFAADGVYDEVLEDEQATMVSELPPVDRGRAAWTYLGVAFLVEGVCWGFPMCWGVFQSYYTHTEPFASRSNSLSVVGTLSSGIPYLLSIFMFALINRYPNHRKNMMWFGLCLCALSCVASSFASQSWQLICSQGVLYGIGSSFLYTPTFSMLNEWFVRRRGLAYGLMFAGTGISGLFLPLLFESLLSKYGHPTTLRTWAVVMLILTSTALYLVKPRLPPSAYTRQSPSSTNSTNGISASSSSSSLPNPCEDNGGNGRSRDHRPPPFLDLSFLRSPAFHLLALSNFFQGLGFFLPSIYLPSYASDLSLPPMHSTIVLSLLNLSTVFGQIGYGILSDNFDVHLVLFSSTSVSAAAVYLLWGMSKTFGALVAFAIVYGVFAGGYSVLWSRFATRVSGEENAGRLLTLIGVFSFQRGIGNLLAGPISSVLVAGGPKGGIEYGYALRKYERMVVFVGAAMAVSCLGVWGRVIGRSGGVSRTH